MRSIAMLVALAALAIAPRAIAQTEGTQLSSPQPPMADNGGDDQPTTSTVIVAELESLPKPIQEQINAQILRTKEQELQKLRSAVSAIPAASAALKANGKGVEDVVAVAVQQDGALLLITTTSV